MEDKKNLIEEEKNTLLKFGRSLRSRRKEQKLSQQEMASLAGIHATYISMIERGEKSVTLRVMVRLFNVLKVSFADFFSAFK